MVRCRSPSRATQAVSEDEGQRRHRSSSSALLPLWLKTPYGALIHIASDCACAWLKGGGSPGKDMEMDMEVFGVDRR